MMAHVKVPIRGVLRRSKGQIVRICRLCVSSSPREASGADLIPTCVLLWTFFPSRQTKNDAAKFFVAETVICQHARLAKEVRLNLAVLGPRRHRGPIRIASIYAELSNRA